MTINLDAIKTRIRQNHIRLSLHAEIEAESDNLDIVQIVEAILSGEVLEAYGHRAG